MVPGRNTQPGQTCSGCHNLLNLHHGFKNLGFNLIAMHYYIIGEE
jgi:hypothetical protein